MKSAISRATLVAILALTASAGVTACGGDADSSGQPRTQTTPSVHHSPRPASPSTISTTPTVEPREAPGAACLRAADHATPVHFGKHDGLGGYLIGAGERYVVLAHQSMGDACQMLPLARRLAAAGFRAFAFDFAGHGSSLAPPLYGHDSSDDVLAAVSWARKHGATSVSLVGASAGGFSVLAAALQARPPVDAVVSLSAPTTWDAPTGGVLDISGMTAPTQLWAARQDPGFSTAARAFARLDGAAELHLEPGYAHGVELVPVAFAEIRRFLDAHLR